MSKKSSKSSFLVQGSILGIASIISRVIGLIYRIPLTNIIGDNGNNIYSAAFEIYNILLLISCYSLPLAVSKLVAARMARGQRLNAIRVFRGALLFAFVTGTIASCIVFFFADSLTAALATSESYLALRVLGPTLLIVAVMGVIRGYFQGMGTMIPSAISQILEQIVNAIVSVGAALYLFNYGLKVSELLGNSEGRSEAFGAAGGTLGTGAGALAALIFLILILLLFNSRFKRGIAMGAKRHKESYGYILQVLIFTVVPVLLSTTIYNVNGIIDQAVFKNVALFQGYAEESISTMWGVFAGKYKVLINVPIALASAMAASAVPSIVSAFSQKNKELVKQKINSALRFIMLLAFPCMVGLFVLADPVISLLFKETETKELAAMMLRVGAVSVIFYSISTLSNAALQGIDRMMEPVKNAVLALVLHIIAIIVMMVIFNMNIYAVIWGNTIFAGLMCIFNSLSIKKYTGYRQEYRKTYIIPCISSVGMGVAVYLFYTLLMKLCPVNVIATLLSIILAVLVYAVLITKLGGVSKPELLEFPGGSKLVRLFEKLRLM